ncbi:MAG: uracil-DNA glycosylase family protein [Blastochloris sp.]|nr:uracil-DNA glycosylase family protein [Blastochloris sp.]
MNQSAHKLLAQKIAVCRLCAGQLPHEPRPVVAFHPQSRVAILGQAPGRRVHSSGKPWDDASGRLLRHWMGVDDKTFYNQRLFALIPMGFCYPGKGRSGDLPPRPECAPHWHPSIFAICTQLRLILLVGDYAQRANLPEAARRLSLTERVRSYETFLPRYFPLPHPSPRNRHWLSHNPWFYESVLPRLKSGLAQSL